MLYKIMVILEGLFDICRANTLFAIPDHTHICKCLGPEMSWTVLCLKN